MEGVGAAPSVQGVRGTVGVLKQEAGERAVTVGGVGQVLVDVPKQPGLAGQVAGKVGDGVTVLRAQSGEVAEVVSDDRSDRRRWADEVQQLVGVAKPAHVEAFGGHEALTEVCTEVTVEGCYQTLLEEGDIK